MLSSAFLILPKNWPICQLKSGTDGSNSSHPTKDWQTYRISLKSDETCQPYPI